MTECDNEEKVAQKEVVPLSSSAYISPYGNLTISFNKPIIVPQIRVDSDILSYNQRVLANEKNKGYDITEIIGFEVNSEFDDEIEKNPIDYFNLTRLDERALDIQIQFRKPESITQSM